MSHRPRTITASETLKCGFRALTVHNPQASKNTTSYTFTYENSLNICKFYADLIDKSKLIAELDKVIGVQSIPNIKIINKFTAGYSENVYDIETATKNNQIYPSLDPMIFEVKYPDTDIKRRVVKP